MAEHFDKGFIATNTQKAENTSELIDMLNKTKAQRDAEALAKAEAVRLETMQKQKQMLKEKFDQFVADTSSIEKVRAHNIDWAVDGFIIEIFVADFSTESKVIVLGDDLYLKYSPYAKILSASTENKGVRADWKEGDIIHLGDAMSQVKINPAWEHFTSGGKSNGKLEGEVPIKYIRHIHDWINRGYYYSLDKAEFMLDKDQSMLTEETMKNFKGPFTFCIESFLAPRRIKGNPWA